MVGWLVLARFLLIATVRETKLTEIQTLKTPFEKIVSEELFFKGGFAPLSPKVPNRVAFFEEKIRILPYCCKALPLGEVWIKNEMSPRVRVQPFYIDWTPRIM